MERSPDFDKRLGFGAVPELWTGYHTPHNFVPELLKMNLYLHLVIMSIIISDSTYRSVGRGPRPVHRERVVHNTMDRLA